QDAHAEWAEYTRRVDTTPVRTHGYGAVFDALALLHHGQAAQAVQRMAAAPDEVWRWVTWIWLHWYVALRAEAAVLAGSPESADRIAEARNIVSGNPIAEALVERADAMLAGDAQRTLATATTFEAAGCGYQAARSRFLAGGDDAAQGVAAIADLGLTPMAPVRGR